MKIGLEGGPLLFMPWTKSSVLVSVSSVILAVTVLGSIPGRAINFVIKILGGDEC
jgi:hypothetical protein